MEDRAGDQDLDFPGAARQRGRHRERQRQVPDRLSEFRLVQPGIPRPHQRAVVGDGLEAGEVAFNAGAHVVVKRALFRTEVGGSKQWEAHKFSWEWNRMTLRQYRMSVKLIQMRGAAGGIRGAR